MLRYTFGLLAALLALPVAAQDRSGATEETEIRRYTVEVIIFRYRQDVGVGNERFLPDEPEPMSLDGDIAVVDRPAPRPDLRRGPLPDTEFARLARADYGMRDVFNRLSRLDVYEPVMHFGWTQATWPQDETVEIPLHRFGRPPPELDGSLTLYLNRFLHLVVDLRLEAPERALTRPVYYRIQEDRILRSGEIRYYDHPKFGVLATVTRVEDEEDDPLEGELLGYPVD